MSERTLPFDLFAEIPPRPGPEMDRVLDATERCLDRYGVRRASMTDIAREMNVGRTTLYRQVASLEEAVGLMVSRELHRFLDEFLGLIGPGATPETFIQATVRAVEQVLSNPVAGRILRHEAEVLGQALTTGQLPTFVERVTDALTPLFDAAAAAGGIDVEDPRHAAGWMVRIIAALVLIPGGADLEAMVRAVLGPMLEPKSKSNGKRKS